MKRTRTVTKATQVAKPVQGIILSDEQKEDRSDDSFNLSPERIAEGATTTTAVLSQILAQQQEFHEFRHWGINE